MNKLAVSALLTLGLAGCSQPQHAVTGGRVSLAKGNISFVLPDSSLIQGRPKLWGADTPNGAYDETGLAYFNLDSTVRVFANVKATSDDYLLGVSWRTLADSQRYKQDIMVKNRGLATIRRVIADSITRTLEADYSILKSLEQGWRGQAECTRLLTIYGKHRQLQFSFSAPDTEANRQRLATSRASLLINPAYLAANAKPYSQFRRER